MTDITPTEYNGYKFPWWADLLGWLMGASTLAPFLVGIIYRYFKDKPVSDYYIIQMKGWVGGVKYC